MAGDNLYPEAGTENWISCFATLADAQTAVQVKEVPKYANGKFSSDPTKNKTTKYVIDEKAHDWYEIVDLRKWVDLPVKPPESNEK